MARLPRNALACLFGCDASLVLRRGESLAQLVDRRGDVVDDTKQRVLPGTELLELYTKGASAGHQISKGAVSESTCLCHHAPALFLGGVEQLDCISVCHLGHRVGLRLCPA